MPNMLCAPPTRVPFIGGLLTAAFALAGCRPGAPAATATPAPRHAATQIAELGQAAWTLVALGDSTPTGYGVGADRSYVQVYAGYLEQDLGVKVEVRSWATNKTRQLSSWAEAVRTDEALRADLRQADVITLWLGWHDLIPRLGVPTGGRCYPRGELPDVECLQEVTGAMQAGFDTLLAEIVALASPADTLILIADVGIPPAFVTGWQELGTWEVLKRAAYEDWRDHLVQAAGQYQVHVVPTYAAINGPDGDQVPPPEYMQSDGLHFSTLGHRLLADVHRAVGYVYSSP